MLQKLGGIRIIKNFVYEKSCFIIVFFVRIFLKIMK